MLISMTGFGEARKQTGDMSIAVEVRTINSRHYKLTYRASDGYGALEPEVETATREIIRRGTVQLNLRVDRSSATDDYRINTDVLDNYRRQLEQYAASCKLKVALDPQSLLSLPGVVIEKSRSDEDPHDDWPTIEPLLASPSSTCASFASPT